MDKKIQFANRAGFNLKFYKYDSSRADYGYKSAEPPLVVDFVNSCNLETTGDTIWATGGQGFKKLIGFDNPLEGTFNIETQITNTPVWAMIAGQDPNNFDPKKIKFTNKTGRRKFYYVIECDTTFIDEDGINYVQEVTLHKASVNRAFNASYTGDGDPQSITIALDLASNGEDDLVTLSFDDSGENELSVIDGAVVDFTVAEGSTETLSIADYFNENGATGVTYALSKNNENVAISNIANGEFTVEGVAAGSSIVKVFAMQSGTIKAFAVLAFIIVSP